MSKVRNNTILLVVACICFALAALRASGIVTIESKIDWTDIGLFFGFLSFIF
jgi:hypothetical protein